MDGRTHVVVIAGGSGTRFWPLSRQDRPKQLLMLDGRETLLAATFRRIATIVPPERWWMVVGERHADACRAAIPVVPHAQVLVEPVARNTAAAIGLAAIHVAAADPEAVMIILPADHYIADPDAFCAALDTAVSAARRGTIATLGIRPTRPETGYGYIERGDADVRTPGAYRARRFCEKPDLARARRFLETGGYDWNAGIFVALPRSILAELARQVPATHDALGSIRAVLGHTDYAKGLRHEFDNLRPISFDHGVMEGAQDVVVIPVDCGWSDVGSFNALDAVVTRNAAGNLVLGRVVAIDSQNCVLHAAAGQVLAVVGISDLAVVQTPDATLVVPLARAQETREVIERLGEMGWNEYL